MSGTSPRSLQTLQALDTLRTADVASLYTHYGKVLEVRRKLQRIRPKKNNKSTRSKRTAQHKLMSKDRSTSQPRSGSPQPDPNPCPQPRQEPRSTQFKTIVQLINLLNYNRQAIIEELTNPAFAAAITSLPDYVGDDPRYLDLAPCTQTPVHSGKRLHARRWIATCYEQWLQAKHGRSRIEELLNDPNGKPRKGTPEDFLESGQCQLNNTAVVKRGILEGIKLLVLELLCGWDTVSAIVNYQWACFTDITLSELARLSLAIKNCEWMMNFAKARQGWLTRNQARYEGMR